MILTPEDVQVIRREYTGRGRGHRSNAQELSERFGVGISAIYKAAAGRAGDEMKLKRQAAPGDDMAEFLGMLGRFKIGHQVFPPGDQHIAHKPGHASVMMEVGDRHVDGYSMFWCAFQFDEAGRFHQVVIGE